MHNRQSGAAHVPIMFFLILLVMFLAALGYGYVQQQEATEAKAREAAAIEDLNTRKERDTLVADYIEDLAGPIGIPGKYEGREGQAVRYGDASMEGFAGVMDPKQIREVMDQAASSAGVSTASNLPNLLNTMVTRVTSAEQRAKDAEAARDKQIADKQATDQALTKAGADASASSRENADNLEQARASFDAAVNDKNSHIATLTETVNQKVDEIQGLKAQHSDEVKKLQGEIGMLKTQLSALVERQKLLQPPDVADGKVLVAETGVTKAFIDLGRKDMLQRGTVFRVKGPGSDAVKGYAEVTRVEDERAEVRLYDFVDPVADFAVPGDLLFNDLYTPRVTRTIYLMGRFSAPYGKEQLTNLLRRLGNRVVSQMGPGVDTVVLGNKPINEEGDGFADIEASPEFKQANELRVEFTYLPKIADLIKL